MAEDKELQLEPLVLLEDEPVPSHRVDELGLAPLAHVVAGTAVGTAGPFTIGVFADWGLGKTSVLRPAKSLSDGGRLRLIEQGDHCFEGAALLSWDLLNRAVGNLD